MYVSTYIYIYTDVYDYESYVLSLGCLYVSGTFCVLCYAHGCREDSGFGMTEVSRGLWFQGCTGSELHGSR